MAEHSKKQSIYLFTVLMGKLKMCVKSTRVMLFTQLSRPDNGWQSPQ
jgi:hypothetical protein